jgi:hypothetical protein
MVSPSRSSLAGVSPHTRHDHSPNLLPIWSGAGNDSRPRYFCLFRAGALAASNSSFGTPN